MNVLSVVGTNRKNGLIDRLCKNLLSGAESAGHKTEMINLYDYVIKDCTGCWNCVGKTSCFLQDDFPIIFEKLLKADIIILGVPCYWGNVPGKVKTFFDKHTGYAMKKPEDAPQWRHLKLGAKLKTVLKTLKNMGPVDGMSDKKFIIISAMTFPFPKAQVSGDKKGLINAQKAYIKKLKGKLLAKIVYTDSLIRFQKNKEAKYMNNVYKIGKAL